MATITIRNLDDAVRDRLRERARAHGRSTEAEVRIMLDAMVGEPVTPSRRRAPSVSLADIEPVAVEGPESGREYLDYLRGERV
jgi:phosphopantothenoylcysteine decarboxylase/phosphopantothenate--cysteine ligase